MVKTETETENEHVEATVKRMAELNAEYIGQTTPLQRRIMATTSWLGQPAVIGTAVVAAFGWVAFNTAAPRFGVAALDPPPFPLLEAVATLLALFTTLLILATQRREEELARRRAQLTLQLVTLGEQKTAKLIKMLEEQRRENPLLPDRPDPEAEDMAKPADPGHVLDRIIETHEAPEEAAPRSPVRG